MTEAVAVETIMHHKKTRQNATVTAQLGVHDAQDLRDNDQADADAARLPNIFGKQGDRRSKPGTTEQAIEQLGLGIQSLVAAQKADLAATEKSFKALEEQGRMLTAQMRTLERMMHMKVEQPSTELATVPEGGKLSGAQNGQQLFEHQDEGEPENRQPEMRKGPSVVSIMEECALEEPPTAAQAGEPRWVQFVHSPHFDLMVGVLIVANTLVMSLELEYLGNKLERLWIICDNPPCDSDWEWPWAEDGLAALEHIFTALFLVELSTRLAADGVKYLKNWANAGDALIVLISSADSWVITPVMKQANNGSTSSTGNVAILRLVRLVRLSKVFRVVRVMKAFKSLRVLVSAVAASVGALAWSMTLLFVLELMGAIFLSQVLRPFIEDPERDPESRKFLFMRFGTWVRAMLTVFEITMAPGGFVQYRRIAEEVHPIIGLFLVGYVCVVTFAVVRVITAMFLKATLSASDQDEAQVASDRAQNRERYAKRLMEALEAQGNNDHIDRQELKQILEIEKMKEWLEEMELRPAGAERLFNALDHGNGMVSLSEFVAALQRMRGPPRSADTIVCNFESRWIQERLAAIEEAMRSQFLHMPQRAVRTRSTASSGAGVSISNRPHHREVSSSSSAINGMSATGI